MQTISDLPQFLKAASKKRLICATRRWQDLSCRAVMRRILAWNFILAFH
jgi:hypothetical protein